jgi:hypothetical protein
MLPNPAILMACGRRATLARNANTFSMVTQENSHLNRKEPNVAKKKPKVETKKAKPKTGKLWKDKKVIVTDKKYVPPAIEGGADTSSCSSDVEQLNEEIFGSPYA